MSAALTKEEDLKYQLMEFSNSDPKNIDSEFEVFYEDMDGNEGSIDICAIELAGRALKRIEELEKQVPELSR